MMKLTRLVVAAASSCMLAGCGTMLHGARQDISVQSSVPGTTVQATPSAMSIAAPGVLNLERKNNYVLNFTAPGYSPATVNVTNSIGTGTVIADVLLTGLIGVVVDGITGAWYGLNPETASATLLKQVGTTGPDEIHVQLTRGASGSQVGLKADAPGVVVEVTKK
jgi:predicted small secreted protein